MMLTGNIAEDYSYRKPKRETPTKEYRPTP